MNRKYKLEYISLGAGVQSTTVALMAKHGEITPMPDCAIFADTGAEPESVYRHLEWLIGVLPFEVHVVKYGNLHEDVMASRTKESVVQGRQGGFLAPPFYSKGPDGILNRQCTRTYKIDPINKKVKELLGYAQGTSVRVKRGEGPIACSWQGISLDEVHRMKPSGLSWLEIRYPLVEGARRVSRGGCLAWLKHHGYPTPPRSACTFCPYHSNEEWRHLRDNDPKGWEQAIEIDEHIRNLPKDNVVGLTCNSLFVHNSRVPLKNADIDDPNKNQGNLWSGECDGMCGF